MLQTKIGVPSALLDTTPNRDQRVPRLDSFRFNDATLLSNTNQHTHNSRTYSRGPVTL